MDVIQPYYNFNKEFLDCVDINRLFKGVKHETELKNSDNNIIHKTGTFNYKFQLNDLS